MMPRRAFLRWAAAGSALIACGARPAPPTTTTIDAAWYARTRKYQSLACGRVAYIDHGVGDAALFLHGFPLSNYQWRGAIARLATMRRCIAPDALALGETEVAEDQPVTPDAQLAMIIALLDRLGVDRVDVIANDSGGAVAQLLMVRYPARVRSALLTNCDVEPDSPPPALRPVIELAHAGRYADEWLVPWANDHALARSPTGLGGLTFSDPRHPTDDALDAYLAPLVRDPRRKALINAYAIGLERNPLAGIEPALRRSTIPTRILWGTADDIFAAASPDYLDRTLGASRGVRRVPGAKLFWPEEQPDVIADEARQLWATG